MNFPDLLFHAKELIESHPSGAILVDRFEVVDHVAELAVSFQEGVLERVLASELAFTGGPSDWGDVGASLEEGSPTWGYATEVATLFNHDYFNRVLLVKYEHALEQILIDHGHHGVPVAAVVGYTPAVLMPYYRRLKNGQTKYHPVRQPRKICASWHLGPVSGANPTTGPVNTCRAELLSSPGMFLLRQSDPCRARSRQTFPARTSTHNYAMPSATGKNHRAFRSRRGGVSPHRKLSRCLSPGGVRRLWGG